MGILELLKQRRVYFDGGTGSLLQERGLKPGELPETWNLRRKAPLAIHYPAQQVPHCLIPRFLSCR